jgi:hypothetical protein
MSEQAAGSQTVSAATREPVREPAREPAYLYYPAFTFESDLVRELRALYNAAPAHPAQVGAPVHPDKRVDVPMEVYQRIMTLTDASMQTARIDVSAEEKAQEVAGGELFRLLATTNLTENVCVVDTSHHFDHDNQRVVICALIAKLAVSSVRERSDGTIDGTTDGTTDGTIDAGAANAANMADPTDTGAANANQSAQSNTFNLTYSRQFLTQVSYAHQLVRNEIAARRNAYFAKMSVEPNDIHQHDFAFETMVAKYGRGNDLMAALTAAYHKYCSAVNALWYANAANRAEKMRFFLYHMEREVDREFTDEEYPVSIGGKLFTLEHEDYKAIVYIELLRAYNSLTNHAGDYWYRRQGVTQYYIR